MFPCCCRADIGLGGVLKFAGLRVRGKHDHEDDREVGDDDAFA